MSLTFDFKQRNPAQIVSTLLRYLAADQKATKRYLKHCERCHTGQTKSVRTKSPTVAGIRAELKMRARIIYQIHVLRTQHIPPVLTPVQQAFNRVFAQMTDPAYKGTKLYDTFTYGGEKTESES